MKPLILILLLAGCVNAGDMVTNIEGSTIIINIVGNDDAVTQAGTVDATAQSWPPDGPR